MKKLLLPCLVLITATAFAWVAANWNVAADSKAHFKIAGLFGAEVSGSFDIATAQINFDPATPASASLTALIKVNSINTNSGMRDHHLKSSDYFDAAKYPDIIFKSTAVSKTADGKYSATGNLTIKQVSKTIVIPFTFSQTGNEALFSATLKINRLDFGIGEKSKAMGDEATIDLNIKTRQ